MGEGGSEGENGSISGKDYRKTAGFDQTGRTMQKTMNFLDKKYIKTQAQLPIIVINSPSMLSPNMFK